MAKEILKRGATSNILRVFLQDSASTTGAGKTALTSASSGLIISTIADLEATATTYTSAATNVETITTLGTFAAPTASKCRFREVDATNFPGVYEIHIADARFAVANSTQLLISIQCTGVAPVFVEYQLVAVDLMDATRLGLSALPNATAGASGGVPLSVNGAGGVNTVQLSGTAQTARDIGASVLLSSGVGTGQVNLSTGRVGINWGDVINPTTTLNLTGTTISTSQQITSVSGSVNSVATGVSLASGAISTGTFSASAINATAIAADALTSAKFADGALIIGATTGTGVKISHGVNSITAGVIADAAIDAATFADSALVIGSVAAGGVKAYLGANSITSGVIANGAIDAATFAAGAIDAAAIATDAIDADALATNAVTEIADGLLARDIGSGTNAGTLNERTVRSALRALRNKSLISSSTLTVTKENDDVTPANVAWTATVSSSATADPVTGIDPV